MNIRKKFTFCVIFSIATLHTQIISRTCERAYKWELIDQGYLFSLRHYPKFFGDDNTIRGRFADRSYLLNNLSGARDDLLFDRGIYLDASLFQFFGSNLRGGAKSGFFRYNGNAEYWLIFDTGKIGLWPRGALMFHAESTWTVGDSINDDVGSILAANSRSRVPVPDDSKTTLSELAFTQFLSDSFYFRIGKLDATGPIDGMDFANNGRFQFIYAGLVNNPIIFDFTSYTSLGVLPFWVLNKNTKLVWFIADADGQADEHGFDTVFNGNTTYVLQLEISPPFKKNLPGTYRFMYGHVTKPITQYILDERHLIGEDIGEIDIPEKCENYGFLFNFNQYLWINPDNDCIPYRHHLPPVGLLLFGRAGWAPKDRNTIDQFYSIGIGSYGAIHRRFYDQWGIGYAATHISAELRKDLIEQQGVVFNNFEHGLEFFYNAQLTPALHLTAHAQIIRPPLKSRKTALVVTARLQADF